MTKEEKRKLLHDYFIFGRLLEFLVDEGLDEEHIIGDVPEEQFEAIEKILIPQFPNDEELLNWVLDVARKYLDEILTNEAVIRECLNTPTSPE